MDILEKVFDCYSNFKGEKGIIGFSRKNYPIYYFCVNKSLYPRVIVQCSMHAREHITAHLCLKLIERFSLLGESGLVAFIPLVNPDGVKIAKTLPLYKANACGVDLNVNFDARWGKGEKNVRVKGQENFIGEQPFSEPESKALKEFTLLFKPHFTISLHCKGEEIYYQFNQEDGQKEFDYRLACAIKNATGYQIKATPNSCGGYKDWCIEKLKIPAFTVEVGSDELSHPIEIEHLQEIFDNTKDLLFAVIDRYLELK